jgi:hypothetical protein
MASVYVEANGGPNSPGRKVNRSHAVELTWGTFPLQPAS